MDSLYDPILGEPQLYIKQFILMPELWQRFKFDDMPEISFNNWKKIKLINPEGEFSDDLKKIPTKYGGIYIFCIVPDIIPNCGCYIMYVGMASKTSSENLRARVRSYREQCGVYYTRERIHHLFKNWGQYLYVNYLPINADRDTIQKLEDRLIACFVPPCNADIRDVEVKRKVKAFANF